MLQSRAVARKTSRAILSSAKCGFFNNRVQRKSLGPFSCSGPGVLTKLVLIHTSTSKLKLKLKVLSPKLESFGTFSVFRIRILAEARRWRVRRHHVRSAARTNEQTSDRHPCIFGPFGFQPKKIIIFSSCSRSFLALGTSNRVVGQGGAPNKPVLPTGPPLQGTRKRGKEGRKKKRFSKDRIYHPAGFFYFKLRLGVRGYSPG